MGDYKRFKDPIYGYIDIPRNFVKGVIDTSEFQRLRRIMQTSYSSLYASSVHNRFVHSLGVYFLGNIASSSLLNWINAHDTIKDLTDWNKVKYIFDLACLLHDVGHAPFSHTGEKFFLSKNEKNTLDHKLLHEKLIEVVGKKKLRNEFSNVKAAAPHEIMSAIIGIQQFKEFFASGAEKEFFARCITGYRYPSADQKCGIYNCFISLLNSSVIDVDRLDYVIRDAYFTGYQSTNIDYQRLLTSMVIIEDSVNGKNTYSIGYKKQAISIIESVVFAHDAERKWIQAHPIILYDMYILQHIMDKLDKKFSTNESKLFSIQTLSRNGNEFDDIGQISLLCDDDIIFLSKNQLDDELTKEYFDRTKRRHPLWKSEAEFNAYFTQKFGSGGELNRQFNDALEATEKFIKKNTDSWIIDEEIIQKIKDEKNRAEEKLKENQLSPSDRESFEKQVNDRKIMLPILESLQQFSNDNGHECNFIILNANSFGSGFNKTDFGEIQIDFSDGNHPEFKKIVTTLSGNESSISNLFYIFYKDGAVIDKKKLMNAMITAMISAVN